MPPEVSIIIPTYNRARLLARALTSVIDQTFQDFEIIVADGSSTDNTKEVALSFGQKVRYFNEEHTGSPASGRNLGLRNASGEYIAFLDSDDIWLPEKLKMQINYFKSNPEYGILYSNTAIIDENGKTTGKLLIGKGHADEGRIFKSLLRKNFIPTHTVIMKREVFERIGYFNEDPSIKGAEDYEYWLRASLQFDIGYMDMPLARYRIHTGGASSEDISAAGPRQNVLRHLLGEGYEFRSDITDQIHRLYFSTARYHWRLSNRLNAKKDIKKYISYHLAKYRLINAFLGSLMYFIIHFNYNNFAGLIKIFEDMLVKLV